MADRLSHRYYIQGHRKDINSRLKKMSRPFYNYSWSCVDYICNGSMYACLIFACTKLHMCLVHMNFPTTKFRLYYNILSNFLKFVALRSQDNKDLFDGNVLHKLRHSSITESMYNAITTLYAVTFRMHVSYIHERKEYNALKWKQTHCWISAKSSCFLKSFFYS